MLRKIGFFFLIFALLFSGVSFYSIWKSSIPLVSPIALIEVITGNSKAVKSPKIVYGFFPYWNIKYADQLNIQSLTHFAYFALDLNPDGTLNKKNQAKELEPGWNRLNSKTIQKVLYQSRFLHQKTVLTVTAMDSETIESIVDHQIPSQTAINSILAAYHDFGFDDLNIDFEYLGEPAPKTRNNFVNFISGLKKACLSINPQCSIDVDIFGDTANKYRLWNLEGLNPITDHFIVMAYDYYRKTSTQAGPVAPISGKCNPNTSSDTSCLDQDIVSHLSSIIKIIPPEKIILGIPFYGYEWQTASKDFLANTYPGTGSLATYARIQTLFSDPTISSLSALWSEKTLSPYLTFEQDGLLYQVHFENSQSLEQKVKLVKSANLGGIAIWALGYEAPFKDLWRPIDDLITP